MEIKFSSYFIEIIRKAATGLSENNPQIQLAPPFDIFTISIEGNIKDRRLLAVFAGNKLNKKIYLYKI